MSIYLLFLLVLILLITLSWYSTYQRYKKWCGIFFLIFSFSSILWFWLYYVSFASEFSEHIILMIYRLQYSLSIIGFYSILSFVLFFWKNLSQLKRKKIYIYIGFLILFAISNFSPFVLHWVSYSAEIWSYLEIYGPLYFLIVFLYSILFPLFVYVFYYKLHKLNSLDRVRLSYIIFWFLIFIGASLILTVFIPYFSSDSSLLYLEKYLPFLMIPFILSVLYSSCKYDFSDHKIYGLNILIYITSIILAVSWWKLIHIFLWYFSENFNVFWNISNSPTFIDIFFAILLFILFFNVLKKYNIQGVAKEKLLALQDQIPFITNIDALNIFLKKKFFKELLIQDIKIIQNTKKHVLLKNFFLKYPDITNLVNDFVFLQKHKHKIDIRYLKQQLTDDVSLVFPLRGKKNTVIAFLYIGKKRLLGAYSTQEIKEFQDFSNFIQGHLKYIDIYREIQELTFSLDKKVDEKTIEYNNLLNKQKEFIAYVWHEIKNPITNTLFLIDSLMDATQEWGDKQALEDCSILYEELQKVSKLVKHIFSAEKFDLDKVELYARNINLSDFLLDEIQWFSHKFPNITFLNKVETEIYRDIDETQFRQVIQNLINNAIKFINYEDPIISISLRKKWSIFQIKIEDNGTGFSKIDVTKIFNKYSTGKWWSVWLWMGLYLCKKIVELHGWTISAWKSTKMGGASFNIKL